MSDFPDEILREIFTRLPVESLLKIRSVCKSWKSLIDSDEFIKDHFNHSPRNNSNLKIIIVDDYYYSIDFDLLAQFSNIEKLSHSLRTTYYDTDIVGSCEGLLVLSIHEEDSILYNILWNPSIRKFHNIPTASIDDPRYNPSFQFMGYGFGYDFVSDVYKFIRIVQFYSNSIRYIGSEVKIYSLKSDSWRKISEFPYVLSEYEDINGEFANCALHWLVSCNYANYVVAIDLGTEEYNLVPLLQLKSGKCSMKLKALGKFLSLVCHYYSHNDHFDLWVMKEYGVQESLSILFTLTPLHFDFYIFSMIPITFSDCGRKVLLGFNSCIMWYDIDKDSVDLPIIQVPSLQLHKCHKSLLLIMIFHQESLKKNKISAKRLNYQNKYSN